MHRSQLVALAWLVALSMLTSLIPTAGGATGASTATMDDPGPAARAQRDAGDIIPGRYIVVLREGATRARGVRGLSRDLGVRTERRFSHVFDGFAAELTPAQVQQLRRSDAVKLVEPVRVFEAHAKLPTGVDRIGADVTRSGARPTRPGAPVAVLDSGIAAHPALNLVGGVDFTRAPVSTPGDLECDLYATTAFGDDNGHGTHVAGIIGASGGNPGVAPGTPLYSVKVLDRFGSGDSTDIICGLEWVAANHDIYGIKVANLSLGAFAPEEDPTDCGNSAVHLAICAVDTAGVAVVVSAGNNDDDARFYIPAKYDQVVAVGAMTDTDGCRGRKGPHSSWGRRDRDGRRWIGSNHGPAVDVIAPGVDIRSTLPGGRYGVMSGTSMAAPHVSAAIALGWDPETGPRELGIPGFLPSQGLVRLSGHVGCVRPPAIALSSRVVEPGDRVTVRLRRFEPRERVRVTIGKRLLGVIVVNSRGSGQERVTIPARIKPGGHRIRARGNEGSSTRERIQVRSSERRRARRLRSRYLATRR